jgi:sterol desaturase/sphingolipid hydroxylase (fatty acid hydroxylase superfamily)
MVDNNLLRGAVFLIAFSAVAFSEKRWPRLNGHHPKNIRWQRNLGLIAIDVVVVYLLMPFTAVMVATRVQDHQLGILNQIPLPTVIVWLIALIWMDLVIYWQHRWFHQLRWLWRLHKVHHIDMDIDVSTGLRFHPGEILLSLLLKCAAVAFMGVPADVVIVSEILINSAAMFNHGNIAIPTAVDRYLRRFLVTPDMHRIHHSVISGETNSNYGFCLSWWDFLFHSYTDQPQKGHQGIELGLAGYQSFTRHTLVYLLTLPFIPLQHGKPSAKK